MTTQTHKENWDKTESLFDEVKKSRWWREKNQS